MCAKRKKATSNPVKDSSRGAGKASRKRTPKAPSKVLEPEVMPREEEDLDDDRDEDSEDWEPTDETFHAPATPAQRTAAIAEDLTEKDLRAISPTDPLRRYMEELRRYPLLEPEEEFRLAMQLREKGDMTAARQLVQANLRLVVKIALEYRTLYSNLLDLIQEGNVGLMKAVSKFDPTKGARLGYYASWWIKSYILKYLLDNFRLVKVGTTQAQKKLFYHLMREKERMEAQGLLAGPKLLAERLDVREKDVVEMEQRLSSRGAEMSLDAPLDSSSEGQATHLDYLVDRSESADEALARQQLIQLLHGKLPEFEKQLDKKELKILQERVLADEPKTLQEIATHFGLTRERARQIEAKMIQKLRDFLANDLNPSGA